MNIEILTPFKGVYIEFNNIKFRRIWSEYDDIVLWECYDDLKSEWKSVKANAHDKLERLYHNTLNNNTQKELSNLLEFLKNGI
jgi:hypothetical protein